MFAHNLYDADYEDEDDDEQRPLVSSMSNLLQFEQQAVADEQAGTVSFITAVLLGIALCFHSLLEVHIPLLIPCTNFVPSSLFPV